MKKYIVITGASSGIGKTVAFEFAKRGENLILVARREELLNSLRTTLSTKFLGIDIVVKVCDLSIIQNVIELYDELKNYELKALINNAGFGDYGDIGGENLEKIDQMLNLNITALTILSHLFVRDYRQKDTTLINISSTGGYTIVPRAVTYCATKFYVSAFSEGLYHQLAQDSSAKMRVKILAPAATKTEFGAVATGNKNYEYNENFKQWHSVEQMAEFLMQLYDSEFCIGLVDRNTLEFQLSNPKFNHAFKQQQ